MKKKLVTRFPAARIKKIMQSDEDVGKIQMAVPLLVSKALERFLQDLCDRTYDITIKRGAKTLTSSHLKQCVQTFNVFDFLGEIVSKVPDFGGSDTAGEDRNPAKRRKVADSNEIGSDEDSNRTKMHKIGHTSGGGRGRGRGRGNRAVEKETAAENEKYEDDPDLTSVDDKLGVIHRGPDDDDEPEDLKEHVHGSRNQEASIHDFDLNVDLNETWDSKKELTAAAIPPSSLTRATPEVYDELLGWSFAEVEKVGFNPIQLANLHREMHEVEEDYDEES